MLNHSTDIKPFIIRRFPESMSHLCPVRAVIKWLKDSGIQSGPLFRPMDKYHEPLMMSKRSLVCRFAPRVHTIHKNTGSSVFLPILPQQSGWHWNRWCLLLCDSFISSRWHSMVICWFAMATTSNLWVWWVVKWLFTLDYRQVLNFYQRWGNIEPGRFL